MTAADVGRLAELARLEAESHPAGTRARRTAAHLHIAMTVPPVSTVSAARRAVATFGTEATQAAALELLDKITRQETAQ